MREEALALIDTAMERTHFRSLFDQVLITSEGSWQGHLTKVTNAVTAKSTGFNTFFITDRLSVLGVVHELVKIRSIWYSHQDCSVTTKDNLRILRTGEKPDFITVGFCSLPSLFSYAAKADADYIGSNDVDFRSLIK